MADNNGNDGGQGGGGQGGGAGSGGEGAKWFDAFPEVKADATLLQSVSRFDSPVAAFRAIGQQAPTFGEKWREDLIATLPEAERPDELKRLQRYATPKDFFNADRQAHQKLRSGEAFKAPGADATPEQVAEYRKANGIPEKPDGYFAKLPNGLVIGEDDLPLFQSFGAVLHAVHAPPNVAHAAVKWYNDFATQQIAARLDKDGADSSARDEALRSEYGADYQSNMNILESYFEVLPQDVVALLRQARGPDDSRLFNNPAVVKALVSQARELGITATNVGIDGRPSGKSLDDERAEIQKFMRTNRADYNKDEKMQQRYRDIVAAIQRRDAREKGSRAA